MGGILAFVDLKYSVGRWQGGGGRHQVYTKYKLKLLLLIQGKIYTLDQHPSFVLSPLSLNAKMLGSLYKLSPAEGEVRGCISCAYPKFACFFVLFCFLILCMVTYRLVIFILPLLRPIALGPEPSSETFINGFTCSSHALCSEDIFFFFVLHPLFPKLHCGFFIYSSLKLCPLNYHLTTQPAQRRLATAWLYRPPACFTLSSSHADSVQVHFTLFCTSFLWPSLHQL